MCHIPIGIGNGCNVDEHTGRENSWKIAAPEIAAFRGRMVAVAAGFQSIPSLFSNNAIIMVLSLRVRELMVEF